MRILGKNSDEFLILARPIDNIVSGDFLLVEEGKTRALLQVYEETYLDTLGLVEDIVRDDLIKSSSEGVDIDPIGVNSISETIHDLRILKCKTRGSFMTNSSVTRGHNIPSRPSSNLRRLTTNQVFELIGRDRSIDFSPGKTRDGEEFYLSGRDLDGSLNIITGRKGSGKSHLSKIIASGLAELGASVIVFDLNDEYRGLSLKRDGQKSDMGDKTEIFVPGDSLKFSLKYLGLRATLSILQHVLDIPGASLREFTKIWHRLEETGNLSSISLGEMIKSWRCNELVRDALLSRFHTINSSGLLTDNEEQVVRLEDIVNSSDEGRIIIVSMGRVSPLIRRMTVELILGKLTHLLEENLIRPLFLFAEEAHLYLRDTYWDDLVTRMRHFGLFPTLITNQPDAIDHSIYRQADNIFLFNFTNDLDLEMISRTSTIDASSVKSMVKTLQRGDCLILGKAVQDIPTLIRVPETDIMTMGETKLFFTSNKNNNVGQNIKLPSIG